jgi:ribulose-5-phosphate 4-epimerase/fuculose-1-phosphate aldolase
MKKQTEKYSRKLLEHRLARPGGTAVYALDDALTASGEAAAAAPWKKLFDHLNILGLIFCGPSDYGRIIMDEVTRGVSRVLPEDCETRTFLHDIPVAEPDDWKGIVASMKERKGIIVRGEGFLTHGSITLEQAFVSCSSIMHALFIKYFVDFERLAAAVAAGKKGAASSFADRIEAFRKLRQAIPPAPVTERPVALGPFTDGESAASAMDEAGREVVRQWLVDSYFGNISYRVDDVLYISQTASSLDELPGCIDAVPLDGSSSAGITASSELPAHLGIVEATGCRAILHGHPKFSIVMSMICDKKETCRFDCYTECPEARSILDVPTVIGEIGAGGLARTVPVAIPGRRGAVVFGHGVFTCGATDFNEPLRNLVDIERQCRDLYFERVEAHLAKL